MTSKNNYISKKCHNCFQMLKITKCKMLKSNQNKPTSSDSLTKTIQQSKSTVCAYDSDKTSTISIVCRICYDGDKDEPIITPCLCKGTVAFVHCSCLEKWLGESNTTACELCHHVYKTERAPKYTARESIWRWFRHQPLNIGLQVRALRNDLLACTILTPLAIIITYICLFSADYYNQQKFSSIPAAKWTSISLLVMISIMLMGYYLWVYMVIRYHGQVWYYCWQRECVVRYIAPRSQNICYQHSLNNCNGNRDEENHSIINMSTNEESEGQVVDADIEHRDENSIRSEAQSFISVEQETVSSGNQQNEAVALRTNNTTNEDAEVQDSPV